MEPNLQQNPQSAKPMPPIGKAVLKRSLAEERELTYVSIEKHRKTLEKLA